MQNKRIDGKRDGKTTPKKRNKKERTERKMGHFGHKNKLGMCPNRSYLYRKMTLGSMRSMTPYPEEAPHGNDAGDQKREDREEDIEIEMEYEFEEGPHPPMRPFHGVRRIIKKKLLDKEAFWEKQDPNMVGFIQGKANGNSG
mgnify:CR=1 FL=1